MIARLEEHFRAKYPMAQEANYSGLVWSGGSLLIGDRPVLEVAPLPRARMLTLRVLNGLARKLAEAQAQGVRDAERKAQAQQRAEAQLASAEKSITFAINTFLEGKCNT